jgi:hypothetical protein
MKSQSLVVGVLSLAVLGGAAALAQVDIRKEPVHFKAGETGATIKGDETVDYILDAQKGQSMVVTLEASNRSAYFNVRNRDCPTGEGPCFSCGTNSAAPPDLPAGRGTPPGL